MEKLFEYKILSLLGEGGMSRVYLGVDPTTHQQVAIKELLPNLAHSKDLRERFRREAQIMAKLDHPNIVKLLKFEETATSFYLIMEYLDGMDLEQHIKEVTGPISEPKAIEIMSTLLDAFGYAHEKGVVHRDIKPANIIITRDGKVKVLDFGIAKIVDENASGRTQTGTRIGTVAYMSPEQVIAAPDIDLLTDIYSLGVMLHQMITGKAAYDTATSSDFEVQTLIVKEPLPRANTIYPYASDHLQKLIDKATQKKREDRFHNCDLFKLELLKKAQKQSEPPTPTPPFEPDKRNNSYGWIGFVVVLLFIIVIVIALNNQPSKYAEEATATDSVAIDTLAVVDTVTVDITTYDPTNNSISETDTEAPEPFRKDYNLFSVYNSNSEKWGEWNEANHTFVFNANNSTNIIHYLPDGSSEVLTNISGAKNKKNDDGDNYQEVSITNEANSSGTLMFFEDGTVVIYINSETICYSNSK
jgi:serine/threonine protein kinase